MDRIGSSRKSLLLAVAVLAIGLYIMPSTLSLFSGQHTFINGSEVSCRKCHEDIYSEFTSGASQSPQAPHSSIANCRVCHVTGSIDGGFAGNSLLTFETIDLNLKNDSKAHAAITVECVFCHDLVPAEITGVNESHRVFYNSSKADSSTNGTNLLKGGNEACIGCHTHIWVNITWNRPVGYNINATETSSGVYQLNFTVNSTINTTYSSGS